MIEKGKIHLPKMIQNPHSNFRVLIAIAYKSTHCSDPNVTEKRATFNRQKVFKLTTFYHAKQV